MSESYPEIEVKNMKVLLGAKALVKWEEAPEEWGKTGLLRPELTKKMYYTGVVLKVGTEVNAQPKGFPVDVLVGDTVLFKPFAGSEIRLNDEYFLILNEDDILGVDEGVENSGESQVSGVKPVGAKVLVRPVEQKHEVSGLIIPETNEQKSQRGVVVSVGLGGGYYEINEGDRLFFGQFSGFQKFHDAEHGRVAIVDEEAIEAVIPPREDARVEDGGNYAE